MEGLCSRQQETQNDPLGRRVHPAILVARFTEGVRPHPAFRIHGQLSAIRIAGCLPPTAGHGTHRSSYGNDLDQFRSLVSDMSCANHCRRETERGAASMEICLEMLFRYVVTLIHPQPHDVLLHVHADVCPLLRIPAKSNRLFQHLLHKCRQSFSQSTNRDRICAFDDPNFSSTSVRFSLLSP